MQKQRRFRRFLLILPLAVVLGTVAVCAFYSLQARKGAERFAYSMAADSAAGQVSAIDMALDGRFATLEAYACIVGDEDVTTQEALAHLKAVQQGTGFAGLYLTNASGLCRAASGLMANVADRPYFHQSMAGKRALEYVTSGRFSGGQWFVLSVPVRRDDEVIGVVQGTYDVDAFSALLVPEVYDGADFSFVCDAAGRMVMASESDLFGLAENVLSFAHTAKLQGVDTAYISQQLQNGGTGYFSFTLENQQYFAVYRPIGFNQWTLFTFTPDTRMSEWVHVTTATTTGITLLTTLLVLGMLTLLYFWQRSGDRQLMRERGDFRAAATQSGRKIRVYDVKGNRLVNVYREDDLGWRPTPQQMVDEGLVAPESAEAYLAFYEQMRRGDEGGSAECRMKGADGELRWYHADFTLLRDAQGQPDHTVVTVFDNSDAMRRELQYKTWQDGVNALASQAALYQEINLTQNRLEKELGDPAYLVGDRAEPTLEGCAQYGLTHYFSPDDAARCREFLSRERLLMRFFGGDAEDSMELRLLAPGNESRWFRVTASMADVPGTRDVRLMLTYADIDAAKNEQLRLLRLSQQDSLTGLLNREALKERITGALAACAPDRPVAMLMIDLDNFKTVNDTFGHQRGDAIIRESAATIARVFRNEDLVGRIGGDEFMAFLVGASHESLRRRAEALCRACQFSVGDVLLSASVGGCVLRAGDATYSLLYQLSDAALYHAKSDCKGTYYLHADEETAERPATPTVEGDEQATTVQLQALLEYMDAGVILFEIGPAIQPLYVSPSFYRVMRRSAESVSYSGITSLVYQDDRETLFATARVAAEEGGVLDTTYRTYDSDGQIGWRHIRAVRIPYAESKYPVLIAVITDISTLRRQDEAVRLSQQVYQVAMSHTNTFIWEVDVRSGRLTLSSKLLEYHSHGKPIHEASLEAIMSTGLYLEEDKPKLEALLAAIGEGKPEYSVMLREKRHTGATQWARYSYTMIYSDAGEPINAIGTVEPLPNINAQLRLLEQERKLQEALAPALLSCARYNVTRNRTEMLGSPSASRYVEHVDRPFEELFEAGVSDLYAESDRQICRDRLSPKALLAAFERGESWIPAEYRYRNAEGQIRWVSTLLRLLRDPVAGDLYGFSYTSDIDLCKRLELALSQKPERELLGFLYNAASARLLMEQDIRDRRSESGQCGLILFHLRGMDVLREREGLQAASDVLLFFSRTLRAFAGSDRVVGRGHKGRFLLYAPIIDSAQGFVAYARALCARMAATRAQVMGADGIEPVLGVAVATHAAADYETLYNEAEIAFSNSLQNVTLYEDGTDPVTLPAAAPPAPRTDVDALTGARSRNAFYETALRAAPDTLTSLGVLLADVNQLFLLNRDRGMEYGDELIRFLAQSMRERFADEQVFRVSGDELLAVAQNISRESFITRCQQTVERVIAAYPGLVSFGYTWDEHKPEVSHLVSQAETLVRLDKQRSADDRGAARDQQAAQTRRKLQQRIRAGQFELFLQPKQAIGSDAVIGAEALVRLRDPVDGLVPPARFIPLYESAGVIPLLDLHVLELALGLQARWIAEGRPVMPLAVNFSRLTLLLPDLCESVSALMQRYGVPPELIAVEITENAGSVGRAAMEDACHQLRALGLHLSLDDFGSEYSSLYVLSAIPFDSVKIDKSVIDDVAASELSRLTVGHIVSLCRLTGGKCVAEGVETAPQYETLRGLGCDVAQGYWINKPLPVAEYEKLYLPKPEPPKPQPPEIADFLPDEDEESDAPAANPADMPAASSTDTSATSPADMPDAGQAAAHDASPADAPDASMTDAPDTSPTDTPVANTTDVHDVGPTDTPAANTTDAPDASPTSTPDR